MRGAAARAHARAAIACGFLLSVLSVSAFAAGDSASVFSADAAPLPPADVAAEVFNPTTHRFVTLESAPIVPDRRAAIAQPLPDGRVLIAGGRDIRGEARPGWGPVLSSAEVFNPRTGRFASVPSEMVEVRELASAAPLPGGNVLIAGGCWDASNYCVQTAEVFNPRTDRFSLLQSEQMALRAESAAAALPDGQVLLAGGSGRTAEVFDPVSGRFSSLPHKPAEARCRAVAAPLPSGRVLIAGGRGERWSVSSTAEVFDPDTRSFKRIPRPMTEPREQAVAAALPNGRILIMGGSNGATKLRDAEVFDPKTRRFTRIPATTYQPHVDGVAAPLPWGGVLVLGGVPD